MGRHPDGERAYTPAEKQRRYREKLKNGAQAIPSAKLVPPDVITGPDIYQCFQNVMPRLLSKSGLKMPSKERCDLIAKEVCNLFKGLKEPKPHNYFADALMSARAFLDIVNVPLEILEGYLGIIQDLDTSVWDKSDGSALDNSKKKLLAERKNFKIAAKTLQTLVDQHTMKEWQGADWVWLCLNIAIKAIDAWSEVGHPPKAVNHNSPVCIFVAEVLGFLGFKIKAAAVSEVLRGRRHSNVFMLFREIWANRLAEIAHIAKS